MSSAESEREVQREGDAATEGGCLPFRWIWPEMETGDPGRWKRPERGGWDPRTPRGHDGARTRRGCRDSHHLSSIVQPGASASGVENGRNRPLGHLAPEAPRASCAHSRGPWRPCAPYTAEQGDWGRALACIVAPRGRGGGGGSALAGALASLAALNLVPFLFTRLVDGR